MDRRPRNLDTELSALERDLAALTLRVATLRHAANTEQHPPRPPLPPRRREPVLGDRVRFHIKHQGYAEGVVIGVTPQRVRIRRVDTAGIFLRAPHNVTVLQPPRPPTEGNTL